MRHSVEIGTEKKDPIATMVNDLVHVTTMVSHLVDVTTLCTQARGLSKFVRSAVGYCNKSGCVIVYSYC